MSSSEIIRIIALCVVLAGAETLHGIARAVFVVPRLGKSRALKLSIVSASLLAFVICLLFVPGIGLDGMAAHVGLGLFLALFMAVFDLAMNKLLLHRPWRRALADFDPRTGNYLLYGLVLLALYPPLVYMLHETA